jgi:Polyketide cyclase / dehydrase and lipid transport
MNDRARVSRVLTVLALSALVANFEPWLGVAMVVFFVATTAVWLPVRWRSYSLELMTELPAPPAAVFPYLVDPAKWSLYRSTEVKVVKIIPPGPLVAGSRVVSLMPVSVGKSFKPFTLETTTEVTGLVADEQFSTVWIDRPYERSTTRVEPITSGTRLNFRLDAVMPFWLAAMGVIFDVRRIVAQRRAEMEANYVRLKAILQEVRPQ